MLLSVNFATFPHALQFTLLLLNFPHSCIHLCSVLLVKPRNLCCTLKRRSACCTKSKTTQTQISSGGTLFACALSVLPALHMVFFLTFAFLDVRGSEPPIHGQSLLTFHSADTECVFKCAAIFNVLSAKTVIQNFIDQREFCFTGFNGFTSFNSSDRPRAAESKKSKPEPLSDTVTSVVPFDPESATSSSPGSYRDVKLKNILILQNHKLLLGREALFMLQSDFFTVSADQLPNLITTESSVDSIYENACKLAVLLSNMHKRRSRLEGLPPCNSRKCYVMQRLQLVLLNTSPLCISLSFALLFWR